MSKKRGLSLEEKRDKVLEVFLESADVYVLKDVEKLASKKGVVLQSIKEVLQSLVDDDLVHQERIGASNYFWSFPAETSVKICSDISRSEAEVVAARDRQQELTAAIQASKQGKEDSGGRAARLSEMRRLEAEVEGLQGELKKYADNDPETVEAMRQGTQAAKEAANRWLDNLYALQSWCKRKFEGRGNEVDAFFEQSGFSDSLEYLE